MVEGEPRQGVMTETRVVADVSALPTHDVRAPEHDVVGHARVHRDRGHDPPHLRRLSYFYLRRNFSTWPPEHVFRPALTAAAIQAGLMLPSNIPMVAVDRAARRLDLGTVRAGLLVCSVLAVVMCVVRAFEFEPLNVRWDSNAYGSVAWATVVTHGTLLLLETSRPWSSQSCSSARAWSSGTCPRRRTMPSIGIS